MINLKHRLFICPAVNEQLANALSLFRVLLGHQIWATIDGMKARQTEREIEKKKKTEKIQRRR